MHQQPDDIKIYLYVKNPFETNYKLLINRKEKVGIKQTKIQKYLLSIHKQKMLIVSVDVKEDMQAKKY